MDGYRCFTWGEGFRDHQELLDDLHCQGFKAVAILDPRLKVEPGYPPYDQGAGRGLFVLNYAGGNIQRRVWPGESNFPDFVNPAVRVWWSGLVRNFLRSEVDGLWCDMNEPSTLDFWRTLPPNARHRLAETKTIAHEKVHNLAWSTVRTDQVSFPLRVKLITDS